MVQGAEELSDGNVGYNRQMIRSDERLPGAGHMCAHQGDAIVVVEMIQVKHGKDSRISFSRPQEATWLGGAEGSAHQL